MIRFVLASFCFLQISSDALTQTPWTLQTCIDHAFQHNLQIKQSELGNDRAEISYLGAKGAFMPTLNVNSSYGYNIGMTIDPFTNEFATDAIQSSNMGLSSGMTLFNSFKNHLQLKRAKLGLDLAAANLEQTQNDLALTISSAYLNILFQEEFVNVAKNNLETTQRQVSRVTKLVEAGAAPQSDLLDVQAQEASDIASLISSENARALAKLNLVQLLQLTGEEAANFEIVVPQAGDLVASPIPNTSEVAVGYAMRNFPEIRAAELSVEDAGLGLDIAKTARMPRLFASYSFGSGFSGNRRQPVGNPVMELAELGETEDGETVYYAGVDENLQLVVPMVPTYGKYQVIPFADQVTDNINQSVFLSLSVPIFNGFQVKNSIEQAKVGVLQSEYAKESTQQVLRTSIESAWADAIAAQKTLNAQNAALSAAELSFANTELQFEAGTISALEYADARNRLDIARVNALRTKYDLVFKSKILEFYQGRAITLR
jgi:outer membrane protein